MKSPGFRHTRSVAGHQNCGTCHPPLKGGRSRERRASRAESNEVKREFNPAHGSSFDSWLQEEGLLGEVEAEALRRVNENEDD